MICRLIVGLFHVYSPTAESSGVSAQIGSGVVRGGPEVRFHEGRGGVLLGISPDLIFQQGWTNPILSVKMGGSTLSGAFNGGHGLDRSKSQAPLERDQPFIHQPLIDESGFPSTRASLQEVNLVKRCHVRCVVLVEGTGFEGNLNQHAWGPSICSIPECGVDLLAPGGALPLVLRWNAPPFLSERRQFLGSLSWDKGLAQARIVR